jgi:molecular chaperone GrpE
MIDQQALSEKLLSFIQSEPALPEYLGTEPESIAPFDPYQMVAEWIALRHEVKQQGKLFQTTQNTLQQALERLEIEKTHLQQQLETDHKQNLNQADQKTLWRDLLGVMDALDQAYFYWQEQIEESQPQPVAPSFWQRWLQQFNRSQPHQEASSSSALREVMVSNQQGIALIRRSLLEVLHQRQVRPIAAQGHPFNPQAMYAIGRQENTSFSENTVIQEAVRGYMWGDQILREAQVIVAGKRKEERTKD